MNQINSDTNMISLPIETQISHLSKADIHRRRRRVTFQEGDFVWVNLTKIRQPSSLYMKLHDRKVVAKYCNRSMRMPKM